MFCKRKTAYGGLRGLVGSEMCIRARGPINGCAWCLAVFGSRNSASLHIAGRMATGVCKGVKPRRGVPPPPPWSMMRRSGAVHALALIHI